MVAGAAKRVVCLTCNKQHNFRKPKANGSGASPGKASGSSGASASKKAASATSKAASGTREWQANVADRDSSDFLPYSIHTTFQTGQLVSHPKFGSGYVKETLSSQKLCVLFKDGPRTLVHGRPDE